MVFEFGQLSSARSHGIISSSTARDQYKGCTSAEALAVALHLTGLWLWLWPCGFGLWPCGFGCGCGCGCGCARARRIVCSRGCGQLIGIITRLLLFGGGTCPSEVRASHRQRAFQTSSTQPCRPPQKVRPPPSGPRCSRMKFCESLDTGIVQGAKESPEAEKSRTERFLGQNSIFLRSKRAHVLIHGSNSRAASRHTIMVHFNLGSELQKSLLKCSAPTVEEPCVKVLTSFGSFLPIPLCLLLEKFLLLPNSMGATTARNRGGDNLCPAKFPTASHGLPGDATVLAKVADECISIRIPRSSRHNFRPLPHSRPSSPILLFRIEKSGGNTMARMAEAAGVRKGGVGLGLSEPLVRFRQTPAAACAAMNLIDRHLFLRVCRTLFS
jgi:hypothetical protein